MKKFWTYLLTVALFLTVVLGSACTQKYYLKIDVSNAKGVEFLEELDQRYEPGTSVTVKTPIYTNVELWVYLDGVEIEKQVLTDLEGGASHWEFTFIMPQSDATLKCVFSGELQSHVCYHVLLEEEEATCQREGLSVIGCTECGEEYERTVLPIVDHVYGDDGFCIWCGILQGMNEE